MKRRMIALMLVLVMLCSLLPMGSFAEDVPTIVSHGIREISSKGNITLNLTHEEFLGKFALGDLVTITMGSLTLDMPIVDNYSCVPLESPCLYMYNKEGKQEIRLAANMKAFASLFEIAKQPNPDKNPEEWIWNDGFSPDMNVTVTMKEKEGYLSQYLILSATYTSDRSDYPNLTDEEYANFRMVTAGDIAPNTLYRSASPIDASRGRCSFNDAAIRKAGVTVCINIVDTDEGEPAQEGFDGSYYSQQKRICLGAGMDFTQPENQEKLAAALRFMAENPGVYDIFCKEGKDRTGFIIALLEGLMGADSQEITEDYMTSFYNYYDITKDKKGYELILRDNFQPQLRSTIGTDCNDPNFQKAVEDYILGLGLTKEEIVQLKVNLSGGSAPIKETEAAVPTTVPVQSQTAQETNTGVIYVAVVLVLLAALAWYIWRKKEKTK